MITVAGSFGASGSAWPGNTVATSPSAVGVDECLLIIVGIDYYQGVAIPAPTSNRSGEIRAVTAEAGITSTGHPHIRAWAKFGTGAAETITTTPSSDLIVLILRGTRAELASLADGAASVGNNANGSTTVTMGGVDPDTADALLVCAAINGSASGSPTFTTDPAGMTRAAQVSYDPYDSMAVWTQQLDGDAATGPRVATMSAALTVAWLTVALAAAADTGGPAQTISPASIDPAGDTGTPSLLAGAAILAPPPIGPGAGPGIPVVRPDGNTLAPPAIDPTGGPGVPALTLGPVVLAPSPIAPTGGAGVPTLVKIIQPPPVGPAGGTGQPTLTPGAMTLIPPSIAPTGGTGSPAINPADQRAATLEITVGPPRVDGWTFGPLEVV